MKYITTYLIIVSIILFSSINNLEAATPMQVTQNADTLKSAVNYIKQFTDQNDVWHINNAELDQSINGLIHYIEDENIDTILQKLLIHKPQNDSIFIYRNPEDVKDTINVPGFMTWAEIIDAKARLDRDIRSQNPLESIPIPEYLISDIKNDVPFITKENSEQLVADSIVILPAPVEIPDSLANDSLIMVKKYLSDSVRQAILEEARINYNDSLLRFYIDSISYQYRIQALDYYSDSLQTQLQDTLTFYNQLKIKSYNDSIVASVNDSILKLLPLLEQQAMNDSVNLWVYNSKDDSTLITLKNNRENYSKFFIKNDLNDSLGIFINTYKKNAFKILVQDGVTFTRFQEQQKRDIKFEKPELDGNLVKVKSKYEVITPWNVGGNSSLGFSQTALSNWKKGGKSSLSILAILKGYANYSYNKIKWENTIEMRNGWIKLSESDAEANFQKNDDKLEFTSRFGISAFKKWYYSAELDFETQFFNGYNYPDTDNPISGFLAPSRTLIKVGLDYKPNKNFSLFISPLTSKTVFVRDIDIFDETKFGIEEGKQRFWEPGLNADLKYKTNILEKVSWETKYKMFINYKEPFSKFDVNWENQFSMQLNDYIKMNFLLHLIYDDNVLFDTDKVDQDTGATIKEAKWQVKELITVGFAYNINRQIKKRKQVH